MTQNDIDQILDYHFNDPQILVAALAHASSTNSRLDSNERMEFLGDAILGYVVCEHLYEKFPALLEGELTKIKSAVVSRKICAQIAEEFNFGAMLQLGKGMASKKELPLSVLAASVEAIIAAIYLDGGIEAAKAFILQIIMPHIDKAASSNHQQNFKSVLQNYAQRHMPANPLYVLLDEKGPDHSKCFEICVEIQGVRFPSAWAKCKKEAEQQAALLAIEKLGLATIHEDGSVEVSIEE